jgi:hypothetical protein
MMEVVEERVVATFNLVPLTLEEQRSVTKRVQALMGTSSRSKKFLDRSPTLKTDQRTMGARSSSYTLWLHRWCLALSTTPKELFFSSKPSYSYWLVLVVCDSSAVKVRDRTVAGINQTAAFYMKWLVDSPPAHEHFYEQLIVDFLVSAGVRGVILPPLAGHNAGKLIVEIDSTSVFFPWLSSGECRAVTKESIPYTYQSKSEAGCRTPAHCRRA